MSAKGRASHTYGMYRRLNELMEESNVRNVDIAKATGIPQSTISGYRNNGSEPGIGAVMVLAKYFNVSLDYMMGLTDHRKWTVNHVKAPTPIESLERLRLYAAEYQTRRDGKYDLPQHYRGKMYLQAPNDNEAKLKAFKLIDGKHPYYKSIAWEVSVTEIGEGILDGYERKE